ncbi:MAG: CHAT domain-containing protein [Cyanophyceae cyanobacterium]
MRGGNGPTWNGTPQDLKRAYTLLIKPIEDFLPTDQGDRLIIVPHRELGTIPFAALIDDSDRFLLDRHSITVTPSLQTLATVQNNTGPFTGNPLIVGNPSPMPRANNGDIFDSLPGTEAEATAISQMLNATPILGEQATKAAIQQQLESASILHFATHGEIAGSDQNIDGNWLALSAVGSDASNHKLTLTEIFNSNLNAQLAVLSACNTSSGAATGEGVLGLARAFLKAGVPTVVASLWKVPDDKTQILMEAFYQELLAGKTYADALRLAQLKVRAESPLPRDWAAFVVIGDGDRTLELP